MIDANICHKSLCENSLTCLSDGCREDAALRELVANCHRLTPEVRAVMRELVRNSRPERRCLTGRYSAQLRARPSARHASRIQSAVACRGEVDGVRLLSPQTIDRIFEVQSHAVDLVLGIPLKLGVGYGLPWPRVLPFVPIGRPCVGSGAGGSMVIADADRRLAVAYVMNKMAPGMVVWPIAAAMVERVFDIVNRSQPRAAHRGVRPRDGPIIARLASRRSKEDNGGWIRFRVSGISEPADAVDRAGILATRGSPSPQPARQLV